uniref:Reverse transcriptase domain-containing protein n=1 Tax=Ananas comosus var. bracteatus TaxID=296719 RepID=A0A6V7PXV8_ANACO|nr:unnamed protein product [Ananas comosus var. bracteatus]
MNDVLRPFLDGFVIVYLDHILIYSRSWEEHLEYVKKVFKLLEEHQLRLNPKKCEYGKQSLVYLGFVVGGGELQIDPDKVRAIKEWPRLKTVTEKSIDCFFLRLRGLYKKPSSNAAPAPHHHPPTTSSSSSAPPQPSPPQKPKPNRNPNPNPKSFHPLRPSPPLPPPPPQIVRPLLLPLPSLRLHAAALKLGLLSSDPFVAYALISFYSFCGVPDLALRVLDELTHEPPPPSPVPPPTPRRFTPTPAARSPSSRACSRPPSLLTPMPSSAPSPRALRRAPSLSAAPPTPLL